MHDFITARFNQSAALHIAFAEKNRQTIITIVHLLTHTLQSGNKIMLFGNGGSAADAQHIAAELVNRLYKTSKERPPLASLALTTDTSVLTSISNDSDFSNIFSHQIQALGKKGDVSWALSTSGNSPNVIKAIKASKELGITTIGLTGKDGGVIGTLVDYHLNVASDHVPCIQEVHLTVSHVICELIEQVLPYHQ